MEQTLINQYKAEVKSLTAKKEKFVKVGTILAIIFGVLFIGTLVWTVLATYNLGVIATKYSDPLPSPLPTEITTAVGLLVLASVLCGVTSIGLCAGVALLVVGFAVFGTKANHRITLLSQEGVTVEEEAKE